MFRAHSNAHGALLCCLGLVLGCAGQSTEARLANPEQVHWEDAQLVVEGRGFPAGARGELCLSGRWHPPDGQPSHGLERCVDAWAQAEDQVVASWPAQGAFHGSLSLSFKGQIATLKGTLEDATFAAGAGVALPELNSGIQSLRVGVPTLTTTAALLLFVIAIARTRAGAGLFVIGQALSSPGRAQTRALLISATSGTGLALFAPVIENHLPWFALTSVLLHPALMSWLRGQDSSARSSHSLIMWMLLSVAIAVYPPATETFPSATRIVLLSLGIFVLNASHCWLPRHRITDEFALGVGTYFIAQMVTPSPPLTVVIGVCLSWVTLRTTRLFHWTRPSFAPCLLALCTAAGLEILAWLQPTLAGSSWPVAMVMLATCVTRVAVDVHGSARQLSPIGAPDHTLPDLTLA